MTITNQSILTNVEYGTPSGNYDGSSQDWASDAVKAANYYRGQGNIQTLAVRTTNFEGDKILEATLDADAQTATWFTTETYGDGSTAPLTSYQVFTITGNFTWMRVRVEAFSGGTINSVSIAY